MDGSEQASEFARVLGERLRQARVRAGLSQEELASRIGVRRRAVYAWEMGHRLPAGRYFPELLAVLNVTTSFLMDGVEPVQVEMAAIREQLRGMSEEMASLRRELGELRAWLEKQVGRASTESSGQTEGRAGISDGAFLSLVPVGLTVLALALGEQCQHPLVAQLAHVFR